MAAAARAEVGEDEERSGDERTALGTDATAGVVPLCKFVRTAHIADAGGSGVSRDDLVMSPGDARRLFADGTTIVTVEEKVDGANLGISIDASTGEFRVQNRSHFVNTATARQFRCGQVEFAEAAFRIQQLMRLRSGIDRWLAAHRAELWELLEPGRHVLFGEWCALKHSIWYSRLPDTFLVRIKWRDRMNARHCPADKDQPVHIYTSVAQAFDVFDMRSGRFWSRDRLSRRLATRAPTIVQVPLITQRAFDSVDELIELLKTPSAFRHGSDGADPLASSSAGDCAPLFVEGIVCRVDEQARGEDDEDADRKLRSSDAHQVVTTHRPAVRWGKWLLHRGKIVRPDFVQGMTDHWTKAEPIKNVVRLDGDSDATSWC